MSHIVTVKMELKDEEAIKAAVDRMEGASYVNGTYEDSLGTHKMYYGQKAEGVAVNLPGWNHPVVINPTTGECKYDNYGGSWGDQAHLDQLVQLYGVEVAKTQALLHGHVANEEVLENGDIKLTVQDFSGVG